MGAAQGGVTVLAAPRDHHKEHRVQPNRGTRVAHRDVGRVLVPVERLPRSRGAGVRGGDAGGVERRGDHGEARGRRRRGQVHARHRRARRGGGARVRARHRAFPRGHSARPRPGLPHQRLLRQAERSPGVTREHGPRRPRPRAVTPVRTGRQEVRGGEETVGWIRGIRG